MKHRPSSAGLQPLRTITKNSDSVSFLSYFMGLQMSIYMFALVYVLIYRYKDIETYTNVFYLSEIGILL